jgi:hypothetical protein
MKGFFRREDLSPKRFKQLREFIDRNFPKIALKKINLENVITYLELSLDRFGSFGRSPDSHLSDARKQFNQLVQERLSYQPRDNKFSSQKFERIFQGLEKRENDSVITLNYDLIIENTLNQIFFDSHHIKYHPLYVRTVNILRESGTYDVSNLRENWSNGLFIKLHGSLEWYQCPHEDCSDYSRIIIPDEYHKDEPRICGVCGSDLQIAIVPPTMNKSFDRWPKLGLVWRLAREELTAATEVVFIGVSFAPSDYYLRWLIKSSFLEADGKKKSIKIVDKCPSVKYKIKEMVDIEPIYYPDICTYISKEIESE